MNSVWKGSDIDSLSIGRKIRPAVLLLMVLLAGCGGSSGTSTPTVNLLTNPDVVLFASGRAANATWSFYAMNPDGSGVTPVSALGSLGTSAASVRGIAVNQTGTLVTLTIEQRQHGCHTFPDPPERRCNAVRHQSDPAVRKLRGELERVAVGSRRSAGFYDPFAIYLMKPDGTQKMQVAAIPTGTYVSEITFAPDDQTLYLLRRPLSIYSMSATACSTS